MSARAFLVRGLLCGLLAGLATFATAFYVGESHVQTAIGIEEARDAAAPSTSAEPGDTHETDETDETDEGHHHGDDDDETVVSRHDQRTWGLLTASLGIGIATGGLLALVSAAVVGRIGRLRPGASTALVALIGWVAVSLVPFLKYPATPPAVGNADTIGARTSEYFGFMLISVVAAVLCVALARRLMPAVGTLGAVVGAVAAYLLVTVVAGQVLPTVNELGDFPADTLWYFRRASLITTATMWAVLGVLLTASIERLHAQHATTLARRELAASL